MSSERLALVAEARALFAELIGTFALTFVGAGAIMIDEISHQELGYIPRVVSPGLLVMVMIYTLGDISGAHINPVVTLAFALRGAFAWARVPGYWVVQLVGAVLAVVVLRFLVGDVANLGATTPKFGVGPGLAMEVILTCLLVLVIIGTATESKIVGHNAGIAVGATIALCGLVGDPISGASMNPARSLGPLLVSGNLATAWVYIVGPVAGALLAALFMWLLRGNPSKPEKTAASGTKTQQDSSS